MEMQTPSTRSNNRIEPATSGRASAHSEESLTAATGITAAEPGQSPQLDRHGTDLFSRLQRWRQNNLERDHLEERLLLRLRLLDDPDARRLLKAYRSLKEKPSGLLFNSLIAVRFARSNQPLSDYERLEFDGDMPLRSCLDKVKDILHPAESHALQIWYEPHLKALNESEPFH
jgi:hypothetical protein